MGDMQLWYRRDGSPCSMEEGVKELEKDRAVARTQVNDTLISTVFLAIDHNLGHGGPPMIFETLVFDGPLDGEMDRYATEGLALVGHERMVTLVRAEYDVATIGELMDRDEDDPDHF